MGALVFLGLGVATGLALDARHRRRQDERHRATDTALRASENRLRWALDATSEIVWDWDLTRDTIYHPTWAQTYGFPEERTPRTGEELVPFVHPEDMARFHEEMVKSVEGSQDAFEVEHRALTGTGEWKWMLGRARVVARDGAGRATRLVGTCTDITEKKRMLVRLQIADRMASIGTLAAGVAHEINGPLAYVLANIGYCRESLPPLVAPAPDRTGPPADVVRRCLDALRDAQTGAERMRDIVRDLKFFSRMGDEVRAPIPVGAALRAALSIADGEMRRRARVAVEIPPLPTVLASESRLSQVFLNLLVNAAQAIPEGQPERHEIGVAAWSTVDNKVVVAVRDTGCGIPPEHRNRLFDPFFTTKAAGIGTGLGLSICHGTVTALGGSIEVDSEVGSGSTFRVILPAAPASSSDVRQLRSSEAPSEAQEAAVGDRVALG
jgi:signal transduction histidine kinase